MSGLNRPKILDPKEWASPSGQYRLLVDPTERHGAGVGRYRMTRDGQVVWSGERPFTFWMASVADDGTAAGFAYVGGWGKTDGPFAVALLGPDGTIRMREDSAREPSLFFHSPPDPQGVGVILDPDNDRLVIRVRDPDLNRGVESWWIYRVSAAAPWQRLEPKLLHSDSKPLNHIVTAQPVAGTELILVHWWHYKPVMHQGAAFTLLDSTGKPVWRLDLPGDYEDPKDEDAARRMGYELEARSAILEIGQYRRFTVRFTRARQALTFSVEPTLVGDWEVREVASKPYVPPMPPGPPLEQLPLVNLAPLGSVSVRNPPDYPAPEIRDIGPMACAGNGRLGFLRLPRYGPVNFVLVEVNGQTRSFPLPQPPPEAGAKWVAGAWLGSHRFLVVRSSHHKGSKALAWCIDTDCGTVTPVATALPAIKRIAPLPDGGFVALTWRQCDTSLPLLCAYDLDGKLLWTIQDLHLFGITDYSDDVCLTPSGKLAVLTDKRTILLLEPSGQLHGRTTLTRGEKPVYTPQLRAWVGGYVLYGSVALVLDLDGSLMRTLPPSADDGDRLQFSELDATPDGNLWTTDGQELLRLDMTGRPNLTLGRPPVPERLDVPSTAIVGPDDHFYVLDGRTHAVHVFDSDGEPLRILKPLPADQFGHLSAIGFPPITVDREGIVYVGPLARSSHGMCIPTSEYLAFYVSGVRLGPVDLGGSAGNNCQFQPQSTRRWVLGRDVISLLDREGRVIRTVERRTDGTWIRPYPNLAVSRNGSLAIFERSRGMVPEIASPHRLSIVSADGGEIRTFEIPPISGYISYLALDLDYALLIGEHASLLVSLNDGSLQRFELSTPAGASKPRGRPFLNSAGDELLLYDNDHTFHRYRMPVAQR